MTTAEERGHQFVRSEEGFDWLVGGERFALHLYEVRDKKPHESTRKELLEQAQHDERSRRSPAVYSKDHRVYRAWDYFPSGRLTFEVRDQYGRDWQFEKISARWRDTSRTALEGRLVDLFIWLDQAGVMAREKRLAIEDRDRREKESAERMRRTRIRREAAERVEKVLKTLSETVHELRRTKELIAYLEARPRGADSPAARLLEEARGYADVLQGRLEEQAIADLLKAEHVEFTDELLTPAVAGPLLPRWYGGY